MTDADLAYRNLTDIAVAVNAVISRQSAIITLVNRLRSDLVTLNLIKGSN